MIYLIHSFTFALLLVEGTKGEAHTRIQNRRKGHGTTLDTLHQLTDAPAFSSLSLASWPYKMAHKMEESEVDAY